MKNVWACRAIPLMAEEQNHTQAPDKSPSRVLHNQSSLVSTNTLHIPNFQEITYMEQVSIAISNVWDDNINRFNLVWNYKVAVHFSDNKLG